MANEPGQADVQQVVNVSQAMVAAGVAEWKDLRGDPDLAYVVTSIYMAMEYERLESLGQL